MPVFAMMIAPASVRFLVSVASYGGMKPSNASAPPVVGMLVVWMLSLSAIGMPCSGAAHTAGRPFAIALVGLLQRIGVDVIRGLQRLLVHAEPGEVHLDQLVRRDAGPAPSPRASAESSPRSARTVQGAAAPASRMRTLPPIRRESQQDDVTACRRCYAELCAARTGCADIFARRGKRGLRPGAVIVFSFQLPVISSKGQVAEKVALRAL